MLTVCSPPLLLGEPPKCPPCHENGLTGGSSKRRRGHKGAQTFPDSPLCPSTPWLSPLSAFRPWPGKPPRRQGDCPAWRGSLPEMEHMAVGQNQWYHFGVGAPPIVVYFSGHLVDWGCGILTLKPKKAMTRSRAVLSPPAALGSRLRLCVGAHQHGVASVGAVALATALLQNCSDHPTNTLL